MVPDSATLTDADKAAIRASTMGKVNDRLSEVTMRLVQIDKVVGQTLPEAIGANPLGQAVDLMASFDAQIRDLDAAFSEIKQRLAYAKEVSMPKRMDDEECKTFNTEDFRVTRTAKLFASIPSDNQEAAYQWLRDNGYEALIKETVNASSLSGAAKEMMENGNELPEDLFKCHVKDSVSITKKKKG